MTRPLRILYAIPENYPNYRPDVSVLFGEALPALGVRVDLLATVDGDGEVPRWGGGDAFLHRARGRLGLTLADLWQQFTLFRRARHGYDALVIRDKPVLGLLGFAAARLARVPFVYWMSYPLPEQYLWMAAQGDGRWARTFLCDSYKEPTASRSLKEQKEAPPTRQLQCRPCLPVRSYGRARG